MAVNGIEIAVGQVWRMRGGGQVEITKHDKQDDNYPWRADILPDRSNYHDLTGTGAYYRHADAQTEYDLVELISQPTPPRYQALPVIEQQPEIDPRFAAAHYGRDLKADPQDEKRIAHAMAGVGDINGTEMGSGARFNAGKPQYELVPLRLMAQFYRAALFDIDDAKKRALSALEFLADFQERGASGSLLKAMLAMGPGCWADCARVLDYGKRKYAAHNWCRGMAWSIPIACAARHLEAIILGEENDAESGLPHRGHFMCNAVFLATYERTYPEGDDRPAIGLFVPAPAANDAVAAAA